MLNVSEMSRNNPFAYALLYSSGRAVKSRKCLLSFQSKCNVFCVMKITIILQEFKEAAPDRQFRGNYVNQLGLSLKVSFSGNMFRSGLPLTLFQGQERVTGTYHPAASCSFIQFVQPPKNKRSSCGFTPLVIAGYRGWRSSLYKGH